MQAPATIQAQEVVASVPAVQLACYCETEGFMALMRSAVRDRRMARVSAMVEPGGIAAAAAQFKETRTPAVLIVESRAQPQNMLAQLRPLAEVCDPSTLVIVVGHVNDVVLYRDLMRSGVAEYLALPLTQLGVIDAIAGLFRDPQSQPAGRIIAFIGARGGAGSSTLCHNIGWMFAHRSHCNTIIADLDLAFGTSGLNFNQDLGNGLPDAVSQSDRLDPAFLEKLLTRASDKLAILAGAPSLDRHELLDEMATDAVLSGLRHAAPAVMVDMPGNWNSWSRHTLLNADDVVITATPDLASMRNARNLVELLRQSRQNDRSPLLVLNQTGVPKRPEISVRDFRAAVGIEPVAVIPMDAPAFGTAATAGKMLCELSPKSKAAEELARLFHHLTAPRHAESQPDVTEGLVARLRQMIIQFAGKK